MATSRHTLRLLDVNILVALSLPNHAHHEAATAWFADVTRWATCTVTQSAYIRLLLNPKVPGFAIEPSAVLEGLRSLCRVEGHEFLVDDAPLSQPRISMSRLSSPRQVTDLHLVDLAARHQAVLATIDGRLVAALHPRDRHYVEVIPGRLPEAPQEAAGEPPGAG